MSSSGQSGIQQIVGLFNVLEAVFSLLPTLVSYQRRAIGILPGPPPPTYVCNRCAQPDHWYKSCPLVISLLFFLFSTLMLRKLSDREIFNQQWLRAIFLAAASSGQIVVDILLFPQCQVLLLMRLFSHNKEPFPGQTEEVTGSPYTEEQVEVPEQYKCFLCKGLLRDAVLASIQKEVLNFFREKNSISSRSVYTKIISCSWW
ncbi:unnamed protein product [Meloidogyne enterolobii]|uniref:Uncharacterized protein n=1 Tax=Meloidogyne enterolobii TaxID=390850 RepID=A0ACB0XSF0_MELEN